MLSGEYKEFDPPPLFILRSEEVAHLRELVAIPSFNEPFEALKADADAVLDDRPDPLAQIIYEGHVSNHPDRLHSVKHLQDMDKLYALTWVYVVSGDGVYSTKAIEFVEAWANTYRTEGNDVNDNKLLICMDTYRWLKKQMSPSQRERIRKWIQTIGEAQKKKWDDERRGNHAAKRLKIMYFSACLDNDRDRIEWVQPKIQIVWNSTLHENGETYDFRRRDALSLHFSSVTAFLQIAHIGRLTAKDHYHLEADSGGSIARTLEFALPYIKGEKIHPEWVNTQTKLDKDRWAEAGDPYYKPGKPWESWEAYESLLLASAFDKSMGVSVERLRRAKKQPMPRLGVLAETIGV
jgi:hypothetical protein